MPSSISSFERVIPDLPWRRLALAATLLTAAALAVWEVAVRSKGYRPILNDTPDLWAERRGAVKPDSLVVIGDSRAAFDVDLDVFEAGFGKRPIQLAMVGSCAFPVLQDLADDESFHGTLVISLIPGLWMVPHGGPLAKAEKAVKHYHSWTLAQRTGHHLGMALEQYFAFLNQEDLTLEQLLKDVPLPKRQGTGAPPIPPYFSTIDRERRIRMLDTCAVPGPLQDRVKYGWPALFSPPPPPSFVPPEAFAQAVKELGAKRIGDTAKAVAKIRGRGGKVVFVRFPMGGDLKKLEDLGTPRAGLWNAILGASEAPGVYFEDYPELSSFTPPEWSHLTPADATEFSKRLVPHLKEALSK